MKEAKSMLILTTEYDLSSESGFESVKKIFNTSFYMNQRVSEKMGFLSDIEENVRSIFSKRTLGDGTHSRVIDEASSEIKVNIKYQRFKSHVIYWRYVKIILIRKSVNTIFPRQKYSNNLK